MAPLTNIKKVLLSIGRAFEKWDAEKVTIVKEVALQALADIQTRSPVDTGRFRASHDLTIGEPSKYKSGITGSRGRWEDKENPPPAGTGPGAQQVALRFQEADSRLGAIDPEMKQPFSIYITNNLVYAQALENGHSKQAPSGVFLLAREDAVRRLRDAGVRARTL